MGGAASGFGAFIMDLMVKPPELALGAMKSLIALMTVLVKRAKDGFSGLIKGGFLDEIKAEMEKADAAGKGGKCGGKGKTIAAGNVQMQGIEDASLKLQQAALQGSANSVPDDVKVLRQTVDKMLEELRKREKAKEDEDVAKEMLAWMEQNSKRPSGR